MQGRTIHVNTGRSYDITVAKGLLAELGGLVRGVAKTVKAAVITDTNVERLYGGAAMKSLEAAGFDARLHAFKAGEPSKNHTTLLDIYSFLADFDMTRADIIIALGGGVVGDVAGFAAATYMRGLDFVQVPTTLLAQVDSSIGGKTAVDLAQGKNLVGAFWQPSLVVCDPDTLKTLDTRIFADGMAEAIKHTCIKDAALFEALLLGAPADEDFICRNINIKREVVENDEREKGERMLLNFGHTLGHAIEKITNYNTYTHGESVAMGMVLISRFGEARGFTQSGTAEKIARLLNERGLPYECSLPVDEVVKASLNDKKRSGGRLNLVLLRRIGEAFVHTIGVDEVPAFFGLKESRL